MCFRSFRIVVFIFYLSDLNLEKSTLMSIFPRLKSIFPSLKSIFPRLQSIFPRLKSTNRKFKKHGVARMYSYIRFRTPHISVKEIHLIPINLHAKLA